jgi:ERCC4-type nuclease
MHNQDNFTIIVDTREQIPWEFGFHVTSRQKLDTGDYSIDGMQHILCIERKRSVSEIANNITEKRFKDVLDRMNKIPHSFILLEFNLEDVYQFPVGSDIPKKLWDKMKISNKYILKYLTLIQLNYNIHIIYCGDSDNAEKMAVQIMKRVYEKYSENNNIV